jgi:hypothetical protein
MANVPDSQVKKSYDFFRRRLRDVAEDGEKIDPKRIIEKLLMVVMINLSDTDDPYLIFESPNFEGSPLEQADLVRNYFLMRFPVADQQGIYDGLWLPMQTRLGTNLTEFMRHFPGAEGEEARKGDVYAAIRRLVADSDSASVKLLMTRMERLSAMYDRRSSPLGVEPQAELSRFFDHFRRLDFGSVYPLLLTLYEDYADGQFGIEEFVATLGILHSFILRRMVVGVPSNSLSGLFISLCKTKSVTEVPSAWLPAMLARENKNRRWPTDIEFAERWMHAPLYGSRACQVILECLEEASRRIPAKQGPAWLNDLHAVCICRLHSMANATAITCDGASFRRLYAELCRFFSTLRRCNSLGVFFASFLDDLYQTWATIVTVVGTIVLVNRVPLPRFFERFLVLSRASPLNTNELPWLALTAMFVLSAGLMAASLGIIRAREF